MPNLCERGKNIREWCRFFSLEFYFCATHSFLLSVLRRLFLFGAQSGSGVYAPLNRALLKLRVSAGNKSHHKGGFPILCEEFKDTPNESEKLSLFCQFMLCLCKFLSFWIGRDSNFWSIRLFKVMTLMKIFQKSQLDIKFEARKKRKYFFPKKSSCLISSESNGSRRLRAGQESKAPPFDEDIFQWNDVICGCCVHVRI